MENLNTPIKEIENLELEQTAIGQLKEIRKWTNFLSLAGFVVMSLVIIGLLITLLISGNKTESDSLTSFFPLILIIVIYLFPIYYLYRFSSISKNALSNLDKTLFSESLNYLRKHFKFLGILFIVVSAIMIISVSITIATKGTIY